MLNLKLVFLCFFSGFLSFANLYGQTTFELSRNVEFKTKAGYGKYENAVVEASKWLEETDLGKESEKRREVNIFVTQWVSGSPTVLIEQNENILKIYGENIELFALFLASYSRHYIENKATASKFSASKAALISMMNVYKKGINIIECMEMEKLIKLTEKGKLDDYVKKNLSSKPQEAVRKVIFEKLKPNIILRHPFC
jgi:peroxiredoxin family protein